VAGRQSRRGRSTGVHQNELRAKSRDLVRRNAWAAAGVEAFVSNAIGTGIKPQSMLADQPNAKPSTACGGTGARRPMPPD
jgi:capsid protein